MSKGSDTANRRRWALGAPFLRRPRPAAPPAAPGGRGLELSPIKQSGTPDLLGDLDKRLDAARTRLRAAIPPPPD